MKNAHHHLIDALQILNPAAAPAKDKVENICLRQKNGDSLFVNEVIIQRELGMIYAKSTSETPIWHMLPIDELVGLEVGLAKPGYKLAPWFKDATNLPAIIGKLVLEQQKSR